MNQREG